jgi:hypothetical protein
MNTFLKNLVLISMIGFMGFGCISCGNDDDETLPENELQDVNANNRVWYQYWHLNGTNMPSFWLMSDGTCVVEEYRSDLSYTPLVTYTGTWVFDPNSKYLAVTTTQGYSWALGVRLLTQDKLTAEWTTRKSVNRSDTWEGQGAVKGIDTGWEKLIQGTWSNVNGDKLIFKDKACTFKIGGSDLEIEGSLSYINDKSANFERIRFESTKKWPNGHQRNVKVNFNIKGLSGKQLILVYENTTISGVSIEGHSDTFVFDE